MSRWYERANEASFKPVEGGYVFQNPNPWVLARPSYYLVNDAKKTEILVHLGRWRLMLLLVLAINFLVTSPAIMWPKSVGSFLLPAYLTLGPGLFGLLILAAAILLMALFFAVPQIYLARSLRPLLADAPRTEERIKVAEQLPTIAASTASTVLVVGLICALAAIGSGGVRLVDAYFAGHPARGAFLSSTMIAMGVLLASYFVYVLRLKTKMRAASRET
jgi:hypothetical protein